MNTDRLLTLKETQNLLLSVMIDFDKFCRNNNLQYYMIGGTLLGAIRHRGFIPWDDDIDVGMLRNDYENFLKLATSFNPYYEIKNYRFAKNCDFAITRIFIPRTRIDNPALAKANVDKRLYFDVFPIDFAPNSKELQSVHREKILKLKTKLSFVDYKMFNKRIDKLLFRRVLSIILRPQRERIIKSYDSLMCQYSDTGYLCSMASQYDYNKQLFNKEVYGTPVEYSFEDHLFFGPELYDDYLTQLYGHDYMELPPVEKRRPGFDIYTEV